LVCKEIFYFSGVVGIRKRTQIQPDLGVLRMTDMTSALAELAFISNPEEEALLRDEQDRWAKAIARGVSDYFQ
jgi:N-acetylmuramoyl-L-alanine amidase